LEPEFRLARIGAEIRIIARPNAQGGAPLSGAGRFADRIGNRPPQSWNDLVAEHSLMVPLEACYKNMKRRSAQSSGSLKRKLSGY